MHRSILVLAIVALVTGNVRAERPQAPRLFPDSTLAYVRIGDTREMSEAFAKTSMGKLGQDDEIRPLIMQLYGEAAQAFTVVQEELGTSLDELLTMPQGELAIALIDNKTNRPVVAALIEVGENKDTALKLIERGEQEAIGSGAAFSNETYREVALSILTEEGGDGQQIVHCERDGVIMIVSSVDVAKEILDRWDGEAPEGTRTLAENRKFTAIMRQSAGIENERPQISFFADPIAMVRTFARGNFPAQAGLAFLPTLGLNGLKAVGGSMIMATEEFDSIVHLHVGLDNPRRGVLKMLALEAGDNRPERWVPKNVATYTTVNVDAQLAYDELKKLYDGFRGEGALKDAANRRIGGELGVDFEEELLNQFGGRVTYATLFEEPARVNSQTTLLGAKLVDADKFEATLKQILGKVNAGMEEKEYRGVKYYLVNVPDRRPENVAPDLLRRPTPCIGIVGEYLMFSDSEQTLKAALDTQNGSASLDGQADFQLIMSRIEAHSKNKPCMISFERPEESLKAVYGLATADSTRTFLNDRSDNNRFFGVINKALKDHPLPEFSKIAEYLAPSGAMMISDESGLHYTYFGTKPKE